MTTLMMLNNTDKALLYHILKPFEPSADWTKVEIAQFEIFLKRLIYSMQRTGFDMTAELNEFRQKHTKSAD